MKVYGPYTRPDQRKHVIIIHDDGRRQTQSYPRFLIEQQGRKLLPDETVDHINNDFTDDRFENLQILSREENARKEMERQERVRKMYHFVCPHCGTDSVKPLNHMLGNWKKNRGGPYCSRRCAGEASHNEEQHAAFQV